MVTKNGGDFQEGVTHSWSRRQTDRKNVLHFCQGATKLGFPI